MLAEDRSCGCALMLADGCHQIGVGVIEIQNDTILIQATPHAATANTDKTSRRVLRRPKSLFVRHPATTNAQGTPTTSVAWTTPITCPSRAVNGSSSVRNMRAARKSVAG